MTQTPTAEILERIRHLNALVIGDICLDRWCTYDPGEAEPSRETGIPRLAVVNTEVTPGAAGTVANNLVALGVQRVMVLGAIGDDGFGYELQRALTVRGISAELSVKTPLVDTFTYTKLINCTTNEEDQARVDFINPRPLPAEVEDRIVQNLESFISLFDVILISDQAETNAGGVVTPRVRESLKRAANEHPEKIFWVDSRMRIEHFRNMVIKPNQSEAEAACLRQFGRVDFPALLKNSERDFMFITHGGKGVAVIRQDGETMVPTRPIENPVDICGAGDSFSAGGAVALAVTRSPEDAARFGNQVASVTIMKKGTGTASPDEVLESSRNWPQ